MIVTLYEILIAALILAILRWLYRLSDRSPMVLVLGTVAMGVYVWPWIVGADWWAVAKWLAGLAVAGAVVLAYAWLVGRIRAAARERDGE